MKRFNQNLGYSEKRRGRSLDATGAGPFIQLGVALLALIVVVLAVIFLVVPLLKGSIDWSALNLSRTPAPTASIEGTPALTAMLTSRVQTLSLNAEKGEAALADASIDGSVLLAASGPSEERCDRILRFDLATGKHKTITPALQNDTLRMPRESGAYLVWFDAKSAGGGDIRLRRGSGEDMTLFSLSTGVPTLYLEGQYLVFTADAGLALKLYAVDLDTLETAALALLTDDYAVSAPSLHGGCVYYAMADGVHVANLTDGTQTVLETGASAHDPRAAGDGVLWLSAGHGEDTDLYYRTAEGDTLILAKGIVDAAAANGCALYHRDGCVYAYSFPVETFYMLSGAEDYAQLIAGGGDYALWRVLSKESVSYRCLKVN